MKLTKLDFSPWFPWKDRTKIENSDSPGIYILAKFKQVPKGNANPNSKKIIYIGETCSTLKSRWNQFNYSAFQGKRAHSGGSTYRKMYEVGDNGNDLYVAALPVTSHRVNLRASFIRYFERKLIYEYALKYGSQPKLNLK